MDNKKDIRQELNKTMYGIFKDAIKGMPMSVRLGYVATQVDKHDEAHIDWDKVNEMLFDGVKEYDFTAIDRPIKTSEEVIQAYRNCNVASIIGAWHMDKCKACGDVFHMSYGEVQFFKGKGFKLPKRCADCRKGTKKPIEINIKLGMSIGETRGMTAMESAMKKAEEGKES
jgi:hypothetical protein